MRNSYLQKEKKPRSVVNDAKLERDSKWEKSNQ